MNVEKLKYTIWVADTERAIRFYTNCFNAKVLNQNPLITEFSIAEGLISIHGGGAGNRTWTGLTFQVTESLRFLGDSRRRYLFDS